MTTTATTRHAFLRRLAGAAALNAGIYEEVEADRTATTQAVAVVLLSSVAAGLGARGIGGNAAGNVAFFAVLALMAWATWALVAYEIGTRILPEAQTHTDVGELLRTLGFAAAPGLLCVLGLIPHAAAPAFAMASAWMFVTSIVAIRQALDFTSTARAIAVSALGWVLALVIGGAAGFFFGPHVS
jgi:hypothetical protein